MSLSIVDQIKSKLDIVEIISSYIKVEKAGINWKARCPFHNEKTPSFFISQSRQSFYCFGCHEKGDLITFVEKFEGLDFKSAIENLATKAGIEINKNDFNRKSDSNKEKLYEIMEIATNFYTDNLKIEKNVLDYLKKRGLTNNTIEKWKIGYATANWRDLFNHLTQKGFEKKDLLECGLLKKVDGEEKYYDTFRGRIMFPIFDPFGKTIAFSGRTLSNDEKIPKYLNSPETPLFHKSEVLYGFNIAKEFIRKMDYSVIVEGQMDLIMSHQSGVSNTVASSGTAITENHLKKLKRLSNRIIIAFDGDNAGKRASTQASLISLSLNMEVKIVTLNENEDPASLINKDLNLWKKALKNSVHYTDYVLENAINEKNEKNTVKSLVQNVLPTANSISNQIEKEKYVKKIAFKVGVSESSIWEEMKKMNTQGQNYNQNNFLNNQNNSLSIEKNICALIFLEEALNKNKKNLLKEKLSKIIGKLETDNIISNYEEQKEQLIFEIEKFNDLKSIEKMKEDVLKQIELKTLKEKLIKTSRILDKKDLTKNEEKNNKKELISIQQRIKELKFD